MRVPILVVGGDNDLQVPPGNAEALAKAQPRARKAIIAGTVSYTHLDVYKRQGL